MNTSARAAEPLDARASGRAALASLAMYDWPQLQAANDSLWAAIADNLIRAGVRAPLRLTRTADLDAIWTSPDLFLAQTCGYPLVKRLGEGVRLVATPRYRAPGCEGPFRSSAIVVAGDGGVERLAELRGARCAVNGLESDSGMNLLRGAVAPLAAGAPRFFSDVRITGSHLASAQAIVAGEADVAALDAVSWSHLNRLQPALAQRLRVIEWTARTPGLPLITGAAVDEATVRTLQDALDEVACDPTLARTRDALLLEGFSRLTLYDYRATLDVEERSRSLGYPRLR